MATIGPTSGGWIGRCSGLSFSSVKCGIQMVIEEGAPGLRTRFPVTDQGRGRLAKFARAVRSKFTRSKESAENGESEPKIFEILIPPVPGPMIELTRQDRTTTPDGTLRKAVFHSFGPALQKLTLTPESSL